MAGTDDMNLAAKFFAVFASRSRPASDRIVKPYVHDGEGDDLVRLLSDLSAEALSAADIRTYVRDNLWMLTPEAFRYFLPAFMGASLASHTSVGSFVVDLVEALTAPSRADIVEKYEQLAQIPPVGGLTQEILNTVGKQELESFDSGETLAAFHERVDDLTQAEGAAVLAFLDALRDGHAKSFPFGELETAVERHWWRYRTA